MAIATGIVVAASGLAGAAAVPAEGSFENTGAYPLTGSSAGTAQLYGFGISLGATDSASGELFAFCVQPGTDFDIASADRVHTLEAQQFSSANPEMLPLGQEAQQSLLWLVENVTYYPPTAASVAAGAPDFENVPSGTMTHKGDDSKVIGVPQVGAIDSDGDGRAGEYEAPGEDSDGDGTAGENEPRAIDVEHAAFAGAIRKIIDGSFDLTTIAIPEAAARAQELYGLATADPRPEPTIGTGVYAVEMVPTLTTNEDGTLTLSADLTGLSRSGGSSVILPGKQVVLTATGDIDLDPLVSGIQNELVATTDEDGKLVRVAQNDGNGLIVEEGTPVTIVAGTSDGVVTARVPEAIPPGTLLNGTAFDRDATTSELVATVDPTTGDPIAVQQLISAGWAAYETDVTIPAGGEGTPDTTTDTTTPDTTTPDPAEEAPTDLADTGPLASLPLIAAGAAIGFAGLWMRRRFI